MSNIPDVELYPFSIVLGQNFRDSSDSYALRKGDREVRAKLGALIPTANPQLLGRLTNILASGRVQFKEIPGIEPHIEKGVTFTDPATLYEDCETLGYFGPGLTEGLRKIIWSATHPDDL